MHFVLRWSVVLGALLASTGIDAQIYECKGKDGSRIFSGERCGPDAKIVPNIATSKKPAARSSGTATPRPKVEPKSTTELEALLEQCNAGDVSACNTWTKAGGVGSLKEKERKAEEACKEGSLADCEYRYCNGGVSDECRTHVLQVAKVAGDNWYLRENAQPQADGSTRYSVRCVQQGVRKIRDAAVICAAKAGPSKCMAMGATSGHPQLNLAASTLCRG